MPKSKSEGSLFAFGDEVLQRLDTLSSQQERVIALLERLLLERVYTAAQSQPSDTTKRERVINRRIGEGTYQKKAKALVRILLACAQPSIGKLTTSLADELQMKSTTFRLLLIRLQGEVGFLTVSTEGNGQARFVRLIDEAAARTWVG